MAEIVSTPPNGRPALVLNADFRPLSYYPLSLWPWQEVVKAVFLDRARNVPADPEPRRAAVYAAYGLVIVAFAVILAGLWIRSRRRGGLVQAEVLGR